jgi:hypothetical protein
MVHRPTVSSALASSENNVQTGAFTSLPPQTHSRQRIKVGHNMEYNHKRENSVKSPKYRVVKNDIVLTPLEMASVNCLPEGLSEVRYRILWLGVSSSWLSYRWVKKIQRHDQHLLIRFAGSWLVSLGCWVPLYSLYSCHRVRTSGFTFWREFSIFCKTSTWTSPVRGGIGVLHTAQLVLRTNHFKKRTEIEYLAESARLSLGHWVYLLPIGKHTLPPFEPWPSSPHIPGVLPPPWPHQFWRNRWGVWAIP